MVSKKDSDFQKYEPSVVSLVVSWKDSKQILEGLFLQEVVSRSYSKQCLDVDLWFLTRNINLSTGSNKSCPSLKDSEGRLLFQIVLQSLLDLRCGRPCDVNAWKKDESPDFRNCTHDHHICWIYAEEYLHSIDYEMEKFIGLSEGSIEEWIRKIKRDEIFKISSLFS